MAAEKQSSKGQAWFCTTGLPTDIVIEIGEMSFHLHKFPLMSKSRKLHQLITDREQNPQRLKQEEETKEQIKSENEEEYEEEEEDFHRISLPEFPAGPEVFETAAKFCYNVKIELTAQNVIPLRCAAEFLDMADDFADDNLVTRTDRFLTSSVLRNIKDSIAALKSCETLLPVAENLGLVQQCIDSIAGHAATELNPSSASFFGWPIPEENSKLSAAQTVGVRRKNGLRPSPVAGSDPTQSSWLEDLALLSLPFYKRVLGAMKSKNLSSEVIEGSLISYAKKSIPGLSRSSRPLASVPAVSSATEAEQTELLETVISNLPDKMKKTGNSSGLVTVRFLFGLLRTVNILRGSEESRTILEKKIAAQLEHAKLDDLLMPSYSYLVETLYDVDCVERIFGYLTENHKNKTCSNSDIDVSECCDCDDCDDCESVVDGNAKLLAVGKLLDGYLSEIASDANLKPEKFCDLALALPDNARVYDDGLYRAVDVYLKAHPRLSEEEREKVCGVMDCQKLTLEACTHAAQNDRLPLRAVVQVLFFEQLQLRQAIAGTMIAADLPEEESVDSAAMVVRERRENDRSAERENQVLRLDMDSMRSRVQGLERECSSMRKTIARMDRGMGAWALLAKRFGCKFGTQVCKSQQRTVVPSRKSRFEQ